MGKRRRDINIQLYRHINIIRRDERIYRNKSISVIYRNELDQKVYDKYPITQKEKNCKVEKCKRDWLRAEYKKELIEQTKRLYEDKPET
jgi:hypothetical protein